MNKLYLACVGCMCVGAIITYSYMDTKVKKLTPKNETILKFNFEEHEYLKYKDSIIHCASCTNIIHYETKR